MGMTLMDPGESRHRVEGLAYAREDRQERSSRAERSMREVVVQQSEVARIYPILRTIEILVRVARARKSGSIHG